MTHIKRQFALVALLACCAALALSACGKSSSSSSSSSDNSSTAAAAGSSTSSVSHPNVKFALHAGLAFGAFHRYIYKPYKAGELQHPLEHKLATAKAVAAAAFVYRELKLAVQDIQASPQLSKLATPLNAVAASVTGLVTKIKGGHLSSSDIDGVESSISSITSQSSSAGTAISDVTHSIL